MNDIQLETACPIVSFYWVTTKCSRIPLILLPRLVRRKIVWRCLVAILRPSFEIDTRVIHDIIWGGLILRSPCRQASLPTIVTISCLFEGLVESCPLPVYISGLIDAIIHYQLVLI